jgi:hypothetical protein
MPDMQKTPTNLDFANSIKEWWEKNKHATTGPCGGHNVFDSDPEFVGMAKTILGDWEAQFLVEVYSVRSSFCAGNLKQPPKGFNEREEAEAFANNAEFEDHYEVLIRSNSWLTGHAPQEVVYQRFKRDLTQLGAGIPDNEGWFDVVAYSTKERWDGPCLGDEGLDGFFEFEDAKAYADSVQFNDFYKVEVIAYGEHEQHESGETVYSRFQREGD